MFEVAAEITFAALVVYTVARCTIGVHYKRKREYMRSIMKDLTGETHGHQSREES